MTVPYAKAEPLGSLRNPWTRRVMIAWRIISGLFGGAILVALLIGVSVGVGGSAGSFYVFAVGLIAILSVGLMRRGLHRRRVGAIFAYCARGMRLQLPLDLFLRAAADAERGVLRRRLMSIAMRVSGGVRLDQALADCLPELDERQSQLISGAGQSHAIVDVLDRLVEELSASSDRPTEGTDGTLIYLAVALVIASACSGMLMIFVYPKLQMMLRDFGHRGPLWTPTPWWPWILMVTMLFGVLTLLIYFGRAVDLLTRVRRTAASDRLAPRFVPFLGRAARDRSLADFYLSAAHAVEAGQPLASLAFALDAGHRREAPMARDLIADLVRGEPLARAARGSRLPAGDVAVLSTAVGADDLARALRFLAGVRARALDARRRWTANVLSLLATLIVAALVAQMMVSVWGPMISLLEEVGRWAAGGRR